MKKNMGSPDRIIRFVLGAAAIGAGIYFSSWWGVIGVVLVATSFLSWCPAYVPFGLRTCKIDPANS